MEHPLQPVYHDEYGTIRFNKNQIVDHLVEHYPGGLNALACLSFPRADWVQLAQLTGYSVSGWSTLSYVEPQDVAAAEALCVGEADEKQARIDALELQLVQVKNILAQVLDVIDLGT